MMRQDRVLLYACNIIASYRAQRTEFYAALETAAPNWRSLTVRQYPTELRVAYERFSRLQCRATDWIDFLIEDTVKDYSPGLTKTIRDIDPNPEMALLEILTR